MATVQARHPPPSHGWRRLGASGHGGPPSRHLTSCPTSPPADPPCCPGPRGAAGRTRQAGSRVRLDAAPGAEGPRHSLSCPAPLHGQALGVPAPWQLSRSAQRVHMVVWSPLHGRRASPAGQSRAPGHPGHAEEQGVHLASPLHAPRVDSSTRHVASAQGTGRRRNGRVTEAGTKSTWPTPG